MKTGVLRAAIAAASLGCCIDVAAGATIEQSQAATTTALEQCLGAKAAQESFYGVISVTHHDRPIAFVARGVLAGPGSGPITAATRFNLASMGKMFTAVATAQLVDAGRIRWDDPIGKYVASLTPEAAVVTVRQLLTHSSGLGDFFRPQNMDAMLKARTASDLLPLIAAEKPSFPPGSKFGYSNSGFALLGILIERVSGQTYSDYLREHVFLPSGMTDTSLSPEPLATLAVGMTAFQGGPPSALTAAPVAGTGEADTGHSTSLQGVQRSQPSSDRPAAPDGTGADRTRRQAGRKRRRQGCRCRASACAGRDPGLRLTGRRRLQHSSRHAAFCRCASGRQAAERHAAEEGIDVAADRCVSGKGRTRPELDYGMGFGVGSEGGKRWFGHNGGTAGAERRVRPNSRAEQWTLAVLSNRDPPVASTMFRYLKDLIFKPGALQACASATSQ